MSDLTQAPPAGESFTMDGTEHLASAECDCVPEDCIACGGRDCMHMQGAYGGIEYRCHLCGSREPGHYGNLRPELRPAVLPDGSTMRPIGSALSAAERDARLVDPGPPGVLGSAARLADLEALCYRLLLTLGEDPERPGLKDTPRRWAKWWSEFMWYQDANTDTTFAWAESDQMVVVRGIRVWSLCEHHLLPFWCDLTVGYLTHGKQLGLSKFGRIARLHASGLQTQEQLTQRIGEHVMRVTGSEDVAVLADGEHSCMVMRGARTPHRMASSFIRGAMRAQEAVRAEFYHLAGGRHG